MRYFHVLKLDGCEVKIRWIDVKWFEENELKMDKSFMDEVQLIEGAIYSCVRKTANSFKLSEVKEVDYDDSVVLKYFTYLEYLSDGPDDPISSIKIEASALKFAKGKHQKFFRDIKDVTAWLISKKLQHYYESHRQEISDRVHARRAI